MFQSSPQRAQSTQRGGNLISYGFLCDLSVLCGE
jgi:hypothetical protein